MKIILVNKFHYRKGGAETYYLTLGERLEALGHEVAYFSMRHPDNLPCAQEKYFVTQREYNNVKNPLKAVRDGAALIYSFEARRNFEALCEEFKPDIVHLNNVHRQITLSILDALYLAEHRVPVVYTAHDYVTVCPGYTMLDGEGYVCEKCLEDGKYRHCIEERCVKGSRAKSMLAAMEASFNRMHRSNDYIDMVIAPSGFMASKLMKGGWPEAKVHFIQNFVSNDVLEHAADDEADCTDREHQYVLFFGRLSKEKGLRVLIDAFERAIPELPAGTRLLIAGDGPERSMLETMAVKNVELVGFKRGNELHQLIKGAAVACCPSVWYENMPYSILEALAEGTPVIGSRIGGIPEAVIEGETGWLAEPGDVESLTSALVRAMTVMQNREAYSRLQRQCQNYVLLHCGQKEYMTKLASLYQEAIDGKRS